MSTKKKLVSKGKAAKHIIRAVIPDSHGSRIDIKARDAFLKDLAKINPNEIVMLGDHVEMSTTFSNHPKSYGEELNESYTDDIDAANEFLDGVRKCAPNARIHWTEGNHDSRCHKWATKNFHTKRDVDFILSTLSPEKALHLKEREISYYRVDKNYQGLRIPGTIKLGKCFFTHGISHAKNAAAVHLMKFGASVVFGHIHRSQSVIEANVTSHALGAWCPGTLAQLQMYYMHSNPSNHTHGYGLQFVNQSTGTFMHMNVPIWNGVSGLIGMDSMFRKAA